MMRERNRRVSLAWALLFVLAVQEVHAVRDTIDMMSIDARLAAGLAENTRVKENLSSIKVSGAFEISTHWAVGEEGNLLWEQANISFAVVEKDRDFSADTKYVRMRTTKRTGLHSYTRGRDILIMPDASVLVSEIKGMAVVIIVGWQALGAHGPAGSPVYDRRKALFIRTEKNPSIGFTEESLLHWRDKGYKLYQPRAAAKGPYYIREDGTMFVVEKDAIKDPRPQAEPFLVSVRGGAEAKAKALAQPDTELALFIDAMLGQTTCLSSPSQCAFRCTYNPEKDTCGPQVFCNKVSQDEANSVLAPFGSQQKCKALGSETSHTEADEVLAEGVETLKATALDLAEQLEAAPAISKETASKDTLQTTAALLQSASDVLNLMQHLPHRLSEDFGKFTVAAKRAAAADLKHWRGRARAPRDLLKEEEEYKAAKQVSVGEVRTSQQYSVAAKLHSQLVDFLVKRPTIVILGVEARQRQRQRRSSKDAEPDKSDKSTEQCHLSLSDADSAGGHESLEKFVNYRLGAPGYNPSDLKSGTTGLGAGCEHFLLQGVDADTLKEADKAEAMLMGKAVAEEGIEGTQSQSALLEMDFDLDSSLGPLLAFCLLTWLVSMTFQVAFGAFCQLTEGSALKGMYLALITCAMGGYVICGGLLPVILADPSGSWIFGFIAVTLLSDDTTGDEVDDCEEYMS